MKFRPGEPVWCLSDGTFCDAAPAGKYAGTVVRLKAAEFNIIWGRVVEIYVVEIPQLTGTWTIADEYLRPRDADPVDPPGMADYAPNRRITWDRCPWQPGEVLRRKGKIYVPEEA
jgi:hypothetical protein